MTSITLPGSVPFPVTITAVLCRPGDNVKKHTTLVKYRYWDYQEDPTLKEEKPPTVRVERIGTFELPIEGAVVQVSVHVNDEIPHNGVELCSVEEPCAHTVQYGGLCAICGRAVEDEKDYSGYNYEDRATIAMSHDNTGLRISLDEATKIEHTTTERLAGERKLILVVDLDQTVIHATVDPTVGEWQRDTLNPNYPYVKDVRSFSLEEEALVPPGWVGARPAPTKCWYYVKLRPGLREFLLRVASLYELHVYTMATRNYALAIAHIIDPTGEYFGDRILSRDESGLLTHKNLKRLFPVDQLMVVIIDDRGDVWQWEANLLKVVPYDFFVGIGDINLSFLPKKNGQLMGPTKRRKTIARLEAMEEAEASKEDKKEPARDEPDDPASDNDTSLDGEEGTSPVDRLLELGGGENNQNLLLEQLITRNQLVEQQQHERPLAKLQHNLDKIIHDHETTPAPESDGNIEEEEENLLHDDDTELQALQKSLENIHERYYELYDKYEASKESTTRPDLTRIIPEMKHKCLEGIVVLFSGIIPLGINIDNADIVIWCRQFGVRVVEEVVPDVTHVVCRDPSSSVVKAGLTLKVRIAKRTLPDVKIVNPDWIFACLSQWKKVDERNYLIDVPERDWYVAEVDVEKYKKLDEFRRRRETSRMSPMDRRPREDLLSSIEEYDFNDANAEVDDFLAGISEGEDDDAADGEEENDGEKQPQKTSQGLSFLRGLYAEPSRKRRANDDDDEDEDVGMDEAEGTQNGNGKRQKTEEEIDELEKELLDELDQLDE